MQIKTQFNMTQGFLSLTRGDGEGFQPASYFVRIQYSNSIHKKVIRVKVRHKYITKGETQIHN